MASVSTQASKENAPRTAAHFFGNYEHSITGPKLNQIAIPKPVMRVIKESQEGQLLLVWWNEEPFIRLYTYAALARRIPEIHEEICQEMMREGAEHAKAEEQADRLVAELSSQAMQVEPDKQGRIVLPGEWMAKLEMTGSVRIEGRYSYVSIGRVGGEGESSEPAPQDQPAGAAGLRARVTARLNKW